MTRSRKRLALCAALALLAAGACSGDITSTTDGSTGYDSGASTPDSAQPTPDADPNAPDARPLPDADPSAPDANPDVPDAPPPTGIWLSGSAGYGANNGEFATWRGRDNEIGGTWSDATIDDHVNLWTIRPGIGDMAEFPGALDVAVGAIWKGEGESWAAAAAGDYDARWRQVLIDLKGLRAPYGQTFIRFAHEFNGDWWPHRWRVDGWEVEDFKTAWRRFRALQVEVYPEAKLVWCPNDGTSSANNLEILDAWPGAAYVDVVAVDSYNFWPWVNDEAAWNAKIHSTGPNGAPKGLETWRQFAEDQGLPFAIGEWSNSAEDTDGGGGGDAVVFMELYHGWLTEHAGTGPGQIVYEVLFNMWTRYQLFGPEAGQPNAAERYRQLWGEP